MPAKSKCSTLHLQYGVAEGNLGADRARRGNATTSRPGMALRQHASIFAPDIARGANARDFVHILAPYAQPPPAEARHIVQAIAAEKRRGAGRRSGRDRMGRSPSLTRGMPKLAESESLGTPAMLFCGWPQRVYGEGQPQSGCRLGRGVEGKESGMLNTLAAATAALMLSSTLSTRSRPNAAPRWKTSRPCRPPPCSSS